MVPLMTRQGKHLARSKAAMALSRYAPPPRTAAEVQPPKADRCQRLSLTPNLTRKGSPPHQLKLCRSTVMVRRRIILLLSLQTLAERSLEL